MCGFTLLLHSECPHTSILATPKNVLLCNSARQFRIRQGIDSAPADCFPLNLEDEVNIAARRIHFGHCDSCRKALLQQQHGVDETTDQPLDDQDTYKKVLLTGLESVEHCARTGPADVLALRDLIAEQTQLCMEVAKAFEATSHRAPNVLSHITHADLRTLLSQPGPRKYSTLFLNALVECEQWCDILEHYIRLRAPTTLFEELVRYVARKYQKAEATCVRFHALAQCLGDYEVIVAERLLELVEKLVQILRVTESGGLCHLVNRSFEREQMSRRLGLLLYLRIVNAAHKAKIRIPAPLAVAGPLSVLLYFRILIAAHQARQNQQSTSRLTARFPRGKGMNKKSVTLSNIPPLILAEGDLPEVEVTYFKDEQGILSTRDSGGKRRKTGGEMVEREEVLLTIKTGVIPGVTKVAGTETKRNFMGVEFSDSEEEPDQDGESAL